jgi:two-component sensor histidine kinase
MFQNLLPKRNLIFLAISIGINLMICKSIYGQIQPIEFGVAKDSIAKLTSPELQIQKSLDYSHRLFMYGNREGAKEIVENAYILIEENNLKEYKVEVLLNLGRVYSETGNLSKGIEHLSEALILLDEDSEHFRGKLLSFLGYYHLKSNNVDSLTKYFLLAKEWNKVNEPYRNWVLYEQWHHFFINNGDLDEAESLMSQAYMITKPKSTRMDHGIVLHRLQQIASRKGDMMLLAKWTKEYYDLVNQDSDGRNKPLMHGLTLGEHLTDKEKIYQYNQLLKEDNLEIKGYVSAIHSQLYHLYLDNDQPNKALSHFAQIDSTGKGLKYREDYLSDLVQIYERKGNYKNAFTKINEKIEISTQANKQDKLVQLRQLEAKYKNEQKENEIALLKAEDELKNLTIKKANNKLNIALGFSLILISLLGALSYYFFQNRKKSKQLEEQNRIIADALSAKDILLREIHHRVKNNLQIISSLLNLQSNFISDDVALQAINEGKNRVNSMALIHQKLYQEKDITSINSKDYFTDLIESLIETYNYQEEELIINTEILPILLDVDTMIPLGLITNELVSNALKHAFVNENQSIKIITISLKENDGILLLNVTDNGQGVEEESFLNSQSFGNKLIQAFLQKLDADIDIFSENGSSFILKVRKYKIAS